MSIFGDTLKRLRQQRKLSEHQLATQLGITKSTVINLETDYINPTPRLLHDVANFFDVTVDYLLGNTEKHDVNEKFIKVPVVGATSSWDGILREKEILDTIIIQTPMSHGREYFALKLNGNHMNKHRIIDGDIVVVRKQNIAENGDVVAVMLENNTVDIRRYYRNGSRVTLLTDCKGENLEPINYEMSDEKYKIIGKVIEFIGKL